MKITKKITTNLDIQIDLKSIEGQMGCSILIPGSALSEWLAIIWMVALDMGDAWVKANPINLSIKLGRCSMVNHDNKTLRLVLSQEDLVLMGSFFIKYFRDGVAEVDHIDMDVRFPDGEGYLTFKADEYQAPISNEELHRRLGL